VVELVAKVTREPLAAAVADLSLDAGLALDDPKIYLAEREANSLLIGAWRNAQNRLQTFMSPSARSIMQSLGCFLNDAHLATLSPYFGVLRAENLQDIPMSKDAERTLKRLGKYTAIVFPSWEASRLVGFWLVQPECFDGAGYAFLPLANYTSALGMGHAVEVGSETVFLTNDPRVVVRLMARQRYDTTNPTIFTIPGGTLPPLDQLAVQRMVFMPVETALTPLTEVLTTAMKYPGAEVVKVWRLRETPLTPLNRDTTCARYVEHALKQTVPAHHAVGDYLLSLPRAEAARTALSMRLTVPDQAQIRSFFAADDAGTLGVIMAYDQRTRAIDFDGDRIIESPDGWTVDGKLIVNVVIRLTEQVLDQSRNATTLVGSVSFNAKVIPFREDKISLRRDLNAWLESLVTANGGWLRCNPKWVKRLLDVAYEFNKDTLAMKTNGTPYGWYQGSARFRQFIVDKNGVSRTSTATGGPEIPFPRAIERDDLVSLANPRSALVVLAMLGNCVRTSRGLAGLPIVIPDTPNLLPRISEVFGTTPVHNPSIQQISEYAELPLPIFAVFDDHKFKDMVQAKISRHLFTIVDRATFRTLTMFPDWMRLPIVSLPDPHVLRWVFHLLPTALSVDLREASFYSDLGALAAAALSSLAKDSEKVYLRNPYKTAGKDLDTTIHGSSCNYGTQALGLIRQLVDEGRVHAVVTDDGIVIEKSLVQSALATAATPTVPLERVGELLRSGNMLVKADAKHWTVGHSSWSLMGAWNEAKILDDVSPARR
jgi:hypothetical protein